MWMKYNNQSIYGCTQAPSAYKAPENTLLTYNPVTKKLYLHLMQYPAEITLPGYIGKVKYARFLHDHSEIKYQAAGGNSADLLIKLPQKPNLQIPVIELSLY
jgi:alpha-L-fucosidase